MVFIVIAAITYQVNSAGFTSPANALTSPLT
jgi:hypothetical protein